jgi:hypothetical protein
MNTYYSDEFAKLNIGTQPIAMNFHDNSGQHTHWMDLNKESIKALREFLCELEDKGKRPIADLIRNLDFQCSEDYFEYIYESHLNGQFRQVAELIGDLRVINLKACLEYFVENWGRGGDEHSDSCIRMMEALI